MNNEQWEINYKNGRFNRYPFDSVVSFVYSYFGKIKERSAVKILDLGCGGGNHAEFIDKEGFSYYGVDGSNTSVILTREKLDVKKKDRVINTDFRSIPFDDNCFDAIIDRQSLGHNTYNDIKIIVSQIYRVLKIGGYWFCQFFSVNHPDFKYGQHIGNNDYVRFKKGNFAKSGIVHAFDLEQIKNIFSNFSIEYALKIRIEDPIKGVLNSEMWEIVLKKQLLIILIIEKKRLLFTSYSYKQKVAIHFLVIYKYQNYTQMIISNKTYKWIKELFPICRSITGNGVRTTLAYFKKLLPELKIHEVPSGTKAFDWTVPDEWNIKDAFIADQSGNRIVDFKENNLHIVGYSVPVDSVIELEQLQKHLYSLPEQPDAIPYVTSYYKKRWGFCIQDNLRKKLKPGKYHVKIDSTLKPGSLTYGELIIKGKTRKEILLSTYVCHPSMANNELSGPAVTTALAEWILQNTDRKYTYRILFLPETIGSIVYLSKNAEIMKKNTIAGFVITCVGDDNRYSYLQSKYGNTLADRAARHTLSHLVSKYDTYSFLERGSDERQYCSPGIDLPVCSIMRSKYGEFPEYHTSLDNLSFISPKGLEGAYNILKNCLILLEANEKYKIKTYCEPQLGKRGMYPSVSTKKRNNIIGNITNLITYADGKHDLLEIADIIGIYAGELIPTAEKLLDKGLFEIIDHFSTETD